MSLQAECARWAAEEEAVRRERAERQRSAALALPPQPLPFQPAPRTDRAGEAAGQRSPPKPATAKAPRTGRIDAAMEQYTQRARERWDEDVAMRRRESAMRPRQCATAGRDTARPTSSPPGCIPDSEDRAIMERLGLAYADASCFFAPDGRVYSREAGAPPLLSDALTRSPQPPQPRPGARGFPACLRAPDSQRARAPRPSG